MKRVPIVLLCVVVFANCNPAVTAKETVVEADAKVTVDTADAPRIYIPEKSIQDENTSQQPFNPDHILVKEYGVVRVRDNDRSDGPKKISIYNEDGTKFKTFIDGDWTTTADLHPYFNKMDYGQLIFVCVGVSEKGFAVIVDEEEQTVKYIKKDEKGMVYEPWADHILTTTGVAFDQQKNPLRHSPDEQSETIPVNTNESTGIKAVLVKGDWLLVRVEDDSDSGGEERVQEGWVKWRDEQGYLILELYYLC